MTSGSEHCRAAGFHRALFWLSSAVGARCVAGDEALDGGALIGAYAVSCPEGFGELNDPQYFEVFGAWQNRYGRDSLAMSQHFLEIYQQRILPFLQQALDRCPAYVLETMMNALLGIETDEGVVAAEKWIRQIYTFRDAAFERASELNQRRLATLMEEWADDIAWVYPKFLGLDRLGPSEQPLEKSVDICEAQRFYLYELDESFYKPGVLSCLQGQWGTEVVVHHYFKHNCRTMDPEQADWFYVPLYGTCRYVKLNENVTNESTLLEDMDSVSSAYIWEPLLEHLKASTYYQRSGGKDHIFLFADGQGPRIWDSYDMFRAESIFLSPESKCPTWGESIRKYVDVKPCLSSWKDIIIPGHTDYARIQYMRKQNKPSEERNLLLTFHGRAPGAHDAYHNCAVRGKIMEMATNGPHVDVGGFVADYPERKGDSHFCLVPAGTSPWTNHLYESFFAGCIPVILSDEYEVAFQDELDWPSFSIKWPEADTGEKLYDYLMELVQYFPGRIHEMKQSLEDHACWVNWYSMDAQCNPYLLITRRLKKLLHGRRSKPRFWSGDAEKLGSEAADPPLVFAHLRRPTRFKSSEDESRFAYLNDAASSAPT
eukprot:TRINITY_DN18029_c1_g2_i3.p1 TRINITY_DN18029_c1_g2~~TRINITY_DN18029_c1_g2_i3.p1  ORF type:complete len:639 (-),score=90.92 TRINITY_DN18029_c1_g2_i3:704-2500(-)